MGCDGCARLDEHACRRVLVMLCCRHKDATVSYNAALAVVEAQLEARLRMHHQSSLVGARIGLRVLLNRPCHIRLRRLTSSNAAGGATYARQQSVVARAMCPVRGLFAIRTPGGPLPPAYSTSMHPPLLLSQSTALRSSHRPPSLHRRTRLSAASATPSEGGSPSAPAPSSSPAADASGWITRWRRGEVSEARVSAPLPSPRYLLVPGLSSSFSALAIREILESRGAELLVVESDAQAPWTLSATLDCLSAAVDALPRDDRPLRLVGTSVGGLAAALFAEAHVASVERLFLLAPTFDLRSCLERAVGGAAGLAEWRRLGSARLDGRTLDFTVLADLDTYSSFPRVRCPTVVVHGNEDTFCQLEDSVAWVRQAARGEATDGERRLVEVADDHSLSSSVVTIAGKIVQWGGLDADGRVAVDPDAPQPSEVRDHGANWTVYRDWLRSQGLDPDTDMQ